MNQRQWTEAECKRLGFTPPRRHLPTWVVISTVAAIGIILLAATRPEDKSTSAPSASLSRSAAANPRIDFLHWNPWPDYRELPVEAFDAVAGIINGPPALYYCPHVIEARAIGVGQFGNEILAFCTTGTFGIYVRPDTGQIRVGRR